MRNATPWNPRLERPPRPRRVESTLEKERNAWLREVAPESLFYRLFDYLPGVFFFAKDRAGRTMFASRSILDRYRMRDAREMLGLTDHDLNPGHMAAAYVRDDERLLAGTASEIERLELWFDEQGLPDWFVVTKLPVLDRLGRPLGVMGLLRRAAEPDRRLPLFQTVSRAVDIIRRDFAKPLTIAGIAQVCGESVRQLQRRFQTAFGIGPQEFLLKTRVLAAASLLETTDLRASEVALLCGFVDASSFAQQFKQRTGRAPAQYGKRGV